eukprot:TRINITY_DN7846_c0_g1_i1.p1 TRINITY_DN7846_c0_g1~~TRINITY_DN7846_c0_g1_i1.p1  ORF type:complete len:50 (+),score=12.33 TRINITY_DN7846_c0_g1_i1:390-539(+)
MFFYSDSRCSEFMVVHKTVQFVCPHVLCVDTTALRSCGRSSETAKAHRG